MQEVEISSKEVDLVESISNEVTDLIEKNVFITSYEKLTARIQEYVGSSSFNASSQEIPDSGTSQSEAFQNTFVSKVGSRLLRPCSQKLFLLLLHQPFFPNHQYN